MRACNAPCAQTWVAGLVVAMLAGAARLGAAQSTAGLPVRDLSVAGASFGTYAYVDLGYFEPKVNPLDDRRERKRGCRSER